MDSNLKRNIILENYKNPKNKALIDDATYLTSNTNNESCIDEVNLMAKIIDNKIVDIRFSGESCAICTSSTSIMIKTLIYLVTVPTKLMLKRLNMSMKK